MRMPVVSKCLIWERSRSVGVRRLLPRRTISPRFITTRPVYRRARGPNLIVGANLGNLNVDYTRTGGQPYVQDVYGMPIVSEHPIYDYYNVADSDFVEAPFDTTSQTGALGISSANLVFNWGDPGGVKGLAVAVGVITPSGYGSSKYSNSTPQRYVLVHAEPVPFCPVDF